MSISHSLTRKLVSGVAAIGVCVSLGATGASASPAAKATTGAALSGSGGQTAGVLVPASSSLSAYWNRSAAHAKNLTLRAPSTVAQSAQSAAAPHAAQPQGPAGKVAGALGTVARTSATTVSPSLSIPNLGPNGSPWWGNFWSAPATTTGKVFFSDHNGGNWVCSASLVNSPAKNVVITAGHCVYGTAGGELPAGETWHRNWVFAPDYSNGWAPFGFWTARQLWTVTNYVNNGDEQDDLGAAILNTNSSGQKAVNLLGGQGFAWNQSSTQYIYDFGYPAAAPFNGQTLQECDGQASYNGLFWVNMEMLNCNFTGGSSGGPWLMGFNGQWGYINSVNDANGYFLFGGQMGGLYFGNNAGNLYNTVANI
jgi:V8-like Glu-specific endopeptidase